MKEATKVQIEGPSDELKTSIVAINKSYFYGMNILSKRQYLKEKKNIFTH